jgi:ADP-ribose pyrophosphatase
MKEFTRIEPTVVQTFGVEFKRNAIIKRFQTEDGKIHEFTTLYNQDDRAAATIAITKDRKVVTMYQFRAGPERWMYDIPGGGINKGEDAQIGALRELKEETGYTSDHVEFLGTSTREAYINATWHYFLAVNCTLSPQGRDLDTEEQDQGAEVRLISIAEFLDRAKHDEVTDAAAVLMAYDKLVEIMRNEN